MLLVDDDEAVRSGTARLLRNQGFEVEAKSSAEEALGWLRHSSRLPDAVLSDVEMRGMSGVALIDHIRASWPTLISACALFSGGTPRPIPDDVTFIEKPFRGAELCETLRTLLEQQRLL